MHHDAQNLNDVLRDLQRMKPDSQGWPGGARDGMGSRRLEPGKQYERFIWTGPGDREGTWEDFTVDRDCWMVDGEILSLEEAARKIWDWIVVKRVMMR